MKIELTELELKMLAFEMGQHLENAASNDIQFSPAFLKLVRKIEAELEAMQLGEGA